MSVKRILIITYYWPPSGGPAVQRWLSYSAYLQRAGYEVHVLTVDEAYANFPSIDESLISKIAPGIKIYKTRTKEIFGLYKKTVGRGQVPSSAFANESNPGPLKRIARFIRGNFFLPDPRKAWNKFALPVAESIINHNQIDLVITAGPPHSSHLMGLKLQQKFSIKWVADFHDAWTDIIFYKALYHTKIAAKYDALMERRVLEKSDAVLTVGERWIEKFCSKSPALKSDKFHILRMAYDEAYFKDIQPQQRVKKSPLIITYTGTISDNYHPEVLIDALKLLKSNETEFDFVLQFAGILSENIRNYIQTAGLKSHLKELGYLPHLQSINLLLSSDILLLVSPVLAQEDFVIPGKIYEYLAARRTIINITNKTAETARMIEDCDCGQTFERDETEALKVYLRRIWEDGTPHQFKENYIYSFSKEKQAASLIQFLKKY